MGSGHALEAIRRLQNNRILKQEQRSKYEQMRTAVSKIKTKTEKHYYLNNCIRTHNYCYLLYFDICV